MSKQIIFKGTKDGITVIFPQDLEFDKLCDMLEERIKESSKFFSTGVKTSMAFRGREFTDDEEQEILDIIIEHTNIDILFLRDFKDVDVVVDALDGDVADVVEEVEEIEIEEELAEEYKEIMEKTIYYRGSVRGGQLIRYRGSIVVLGDVNVGAEVSATGSIIVLGQLRGVAHAGYGREVADDRVFISAVYMAPMQLRICGLIAKFPKERMVGDKDSELAFIEGGRICVSSLV